jgi:hypothetical protein
MNGRTSGVGRLRSVIVGIVVVVGGVGGCLVGEVQGVPCSSDDQCATNHFCDLVDQSCREEREDFFAPNLQVTGVRDVDGDVVTDPFIDRNGDFAMKLVVENVGGSTAVDVDAEFSELRCLNLRVEPSTLPSSVVAGGTVEVGFSASPDGTCGTPMITDWFLFFSGRGSRGTFNINILNAPPGAT